MLNFRSIIPAALLSLIALAGCQEQRITGVIAQTAERNAQLMNLAAREAAMIPDADQRLTRQLNIADRQLTFFTAADARKTLGEAKTTLVEVGDKLNDHARISGWVGISELSRRADDKPAAEFAIDKAVDALHAINGGAARCQYVMGVAGELAELRSTDPAAKLLVEAGPWAGEIKAKDERRHALLAFATALFNINQYEPGVKILRQEDDAAWRSDMLAGLGTPMRDYGGSAVADASHTKLEASRMPGMQTGFPVQSILQQQNFYGKRTDYQSIFQNRQQSETAK